MSVCVSKRTTVCSGPSTGRRYYVSTPYGFHTRDPDQYLRYPPLSSEPLSQPRHVVVHLVVRNVHGAADACAVLLSNNRVDLHPLFWRLSCFLDRTSCSCCSPLPAFPHNRISSSVRPSTADHCAFPCGSPDRSLVLSRRRQEDLDIDSCSILLIQHRRSSLTTSSVSSIDIAELHPTAPHSFEVSSRY